MVSLEIKYLYYDQNLVGMPEAFKCCLVIQEDSDYLILVVYIGAEKKFKSFGMNVDETLLGPTSKTSRPTLRSRHVGIGTSILYQTHPLHLTHWTKPMTELDSSR